MQKMLLRQGFAKACEVQLAYAIGVAKPVSLRIDTRGTGTISESEIAEKVSKVFDLSPGGIIKDLICAVRFIPKPQHTDISEEMI